MKRISKYLGPGIVAGIIVACSTPIADTAARIMRDAGDALVEAGDHLALRPDASGGEARDTGRRMLHDAARILSDASRGMTKEASAQSCGNCSPGGAVRIATADSDAAQIVSGFETIGTTNGNWSERVPGPFVVTSLIPAQLGYEASIAVGYADPGACASSRTMLAQVPVGEHSTSIDNGRYLVPKGKVLCVSGVVQSGPMFTEYSWSGFKPYE